MATSLLVIGLDAAERSLVEAWCAAGRLPHLQALRERGAWGAIDTPPGLGDDAVWTSFHSGVAPGRHGRYFWQRLIPGSSDTPRFQPSEHVREPFWAALSRAGRKVAVIDVPKAPLTPDLNGVQIADWLVHGPDYQETCSWPVELAAEWTMRYGRDATDRQDGDWLCRMQQISESERGVLADLLLQGAAAKTSAAVDLLQRDAWDLFLVVFKEAHCAGHQLWETPALLSIYQALDAAVGRLLDAAGSGAHVIVFSDLGMAANHTGEHLLGGILTELERHRTRAAWRFGRPPRLAHRVTHNEMSGAIRVNVRGRDADGRVAPGVEYDALCEWLAAELRQLVNADTGRPAVDAVLRTDAVYAGEHRQHLPDLWVVWNREAPILAVTSPTIGDVRAADPQYRRGNHVSGGFYAACGPGIAARPADVASIVDLAPTIAAVLGVELRDTDGTPIEAALASSASST